MSAFTEMIRDAIGGGKPASNGSNPVPQPRPQRPPKKPRREVNPDQLLADPADVKYDPADHPDTVRKIVAAFFVSDTAPGYYLDQEHYLASLKEENPDTSEDDLIARIKQEQKDGAFREVPVLCDFYAGNLYPCFDVPDGKVKDGWAELIKLQEDKINERKAKAKAEKAAQPVDLNTLPPEIQQFHQQWQNDFTDEQKNAILSSGTLSWLHIYSIWDLLSEEQQRRLHSVPQPTPQFPGYPPAAPAAGSYFPYPPYPYPYPSAPAPVPQNGQSADEGDIHIPAPAPAPAPSTGGSSDDTLAPPPGP